MTQLPRRSFLSAAALGSSAVGLGSVISGCGGATAHPEMSVRETTELLSRLERGLGGVRAVPSGSLASFAPWHVRPDAAEGLMRLGVEAAVVTDVARSIPRDRRVPRELADALRARLPVLDQCAASYHHLLSTTPPAVRRSIDERFRNDPGITDRLVTWFDEQGAAVGASPDSRSRLFSAADQIGARARRQSMNAVIDDCLSKVDLVVARSGASLLDVRGTTTGAMIQAIWQAVDGVATGSGAAPTPPAAYSGTSASGSVVVPTAPASSSSYTGYEEIDPSPGDEELIIGGVLMGAGVVVFGLGTLIGWALGADLGLSIMFSATPGSILLIIGLIVLIVGAVQNANAASATPSISG